MRQYILIIVVFLCGLLIGCAERNRENPFDPQGEQISPVELTVKPFGNRVELSWVLTDEVDISGFNIYRRENKNQAFQKILTASASSRRQTDSNVESFHQYEYSIAAFGNTVESKKSESKTVLVGPDNTWIMSRDGYALFRMSYDLQYIIDEYDLSYAPYDWTMNSGQDEIWLTLSQVGGISRVNLNKGYEDFRITGIFDKPIGISWNLPAENLDILDDDENKLIFFENGTIQDTIPLPNTTYYKLATANNGNTGIVGKDNFQIFDLDGNLLKFTSIENGSDIIWFNNKFHILETDFNNYTSRLITVTANGIPLSTEVYDFGYKIIRPSITPNTLLAVEQDEQNDKVVKLSYSGTRLMEKIFEGSIIDISEHPENKSIVVVQRYLDTVTLIDSLGGIINKTKTIYDPFKVMIQ